MTVPSQLLADPIMDVAYLPVAAAVVVAPKNAAAVIVPKARTIDSWKTDSVGELPRTSVDVPPTTIRHDVVVVPDAVVVAVLVAAPVVVLVAVPVVVPVVVLFAAPVVVLAAAVIIA